MRTRRVSGAIALAGVLAMAACSTTATTNSPTAPASGSSTGWFEWVENEPEVKGQVDRAVTRKPLLLRAFAADLPGWVVAAPGTPGCPQPATG